MDHPDEVVDPVLLVVRDDEKGLEKYLAEFCEVAVRVLARDGLEFIERFGKEGGDAVR